MSVAIKRPSKQEMRGARSKSSVSTRAGKKRNGKVICNRYRDNWFMEYFSCLPKDVTPRFPPNPDLALISCSDSSVRAVRSRSLSMSSVQDADLIIEPPTVRQICVSSQSSQESEES